MKKQQLCNVVSISIFIIMIFVANLLTAATSTIIYHSAPTPPSISYTSAEQTPWFNTYLRTTGSGGAHQDNQGAVWSGVATGETNRLLVTYGNIFTNFEPAKIMSAELYLYVWSKDENSGPTYNYKSYALSKEWAENVATWTDRSGFDSWSTPGGDVFSDESSQSSGSFDVNSEGYVSYDITQPAKLLADPNNNGYGIQIRQENGVNTLLGLISSDNGTDDSDQQPYILIKYVDVLPYVQITNANVTVASSITTYTIGGSNNNAVVGGLTWTNANNGTYGSITLGSPWWIKSNIQLGFGVNLITVSGTNEFGDYASSSVNITRDASGTLPIISNILPLPYSGSSSRVENITMTFDTEFADSSVSVVSAYGSTTENTGAVPNGPWEYTVPIDTSSEGELTLITITAINGSGTTVSNFYYQYSVNGNYPEDFPIISNISPAPHPVTSSRVENITMTFDTLNANDSVSVASAYGATTWQSGTTPNGLWEYTVPIDTSLEGAMTLITITAIGSSGTAVSNFYYQYSVNGNYPDVLPLISNISPAPHPVTSSRVENITMTFDTLNANDSVSVASAYGATTWQSGTTPNGPWEYTVPIDTSSEGAMTLITITAIGSSGTAVSNFYYQYSVNGNYPDALPLISNISPAPHPVTSSRVENITMTFDTLNANDSVLVASMYGATTWQSGTTPNGPWEYTVPINTSVEGAMTLITITAIGSSGTAVSNFYYQYSINGNYPSGGYRAPTIMVDQPATSPALVAYNATNYMVYGRAADLETGIEKVTVDGDVCGTEFWYKDIDIGVPGTTTTLTIIAYDNDLIQKTSTAEVVLVHCANPNCIDLTPPILTIKQPADNVHTVAYNVASFTVSGTANDPESGIDYVTVDDVNSGGPIWARTVLIGAQGSSTSVKVIAYNRANPQLTTTNYVTIYRSNDSGTIDTTMPWLTIIDPDISPKFVAYNVETYTLRGNAGDPESGISNVTVGGVHAGVENWDLNISLGNPGDTTTVEVVAYNNATPQLSIRKTVVIIRSANSADTDYSKPVLTVLEPPSTPYVVANNAAFYVVSGTAIDKESGIAYVDVNGTPAGGGNWAQKVALGEPGTTTTVTIVAYNNATPQLTATETVKIIRSTDTSYLDISSPMLNVVSPPTQYYHVWTGTVSYLVSGTASDLESGINRVVLGGMIAGNTVWQQDVGLGSVGSTTEVEIVAYNNAIPELSTNATVYIIRDDDSFKGPDLTAPTLMIDQPGESPKVVAYDVTEYMVYGRAADLETGINRVTANGIPCGTEQWSQLIQLGSPGSTTFVTFVAYNNANPQLSTSETVLLIRSDDSSNLDVSAPVLIIEQPADNVYTVSYNTVTYTVCGKAYDTESGIDKVTVNGIYSGGPVWWNVVQLGEPGSSTEVEVIAYNKAIPQLTTTKFVTIIRSEDSNDIDTSEPWLTVIDPDVSPKFVASNVETYTLYGTAGDPQSGISNVTVGGVHAGVVNWDLKIALGAPGSTTSVEIVAYNNATPQLSISKTVVIIRAYNGGDDITPPILTVLQPPSSPYTVSNNVPYYVVSGTALDEQSGIDVVTVNGSPAGGSEWAKLVSLGMPGSTTTVTIVAYNNSSPQLSSSKTVQIIRATDLSGKDTTSPMLIVNTPPTQYYFVGQTPSNYIVSGTANDPDSGINRVTVGGTISGMTYWHQNVTLGAIGGTTAVEIIAYNNADPVLSTQTIVYLIRDVEKADDAIYIEVISPAGMPVYPVPTDVAVTGIATDDVQVTSITCNDIDIFSSYVDPDWSDSISAASLVAGTNSFVYVATDDLGNTATDVLAIVVLGEANDFDARVLETWPRYIGETQSGTVEFVSILDASWQLKVVNMPDSSTQTVANGICTAGWNLVHFYGGDLPIVDDESSNLFKLVIGEELGDNVKNELDAFSVTVVDDLEINPKVPTTDFDGDLIYIKYVSKTGGKLSSYGRTLVIEDGSPKDKLMIKVKPLKGKGDGVATICGVIVKDGALKMIKHSGDLDRLQVDGIFGKLMIKGGSLGTPSRTIRYNCRFNSQAIKSKSMIMLKAGKNKTTKLNIPANCYANILAGELASEPNTIDKLAGLKAIKITGGNFGVEYNKDTKTTYRHWLTAKYIDMVMVKPKAKIVGGYTFDYSFYFTGEGKPTKGSFKKMYFYYGSEDSSEDNQNNANIICGYDEDINPVEITGTNWIGKEVEYGFGKLMTKSGELQGTVGLKRWIKGKQKQFKGQEDARWIVDEEEE